MMPTTVNIRISANDFKELITTLEGVRDGARERTRIAVDVTPQARQQARQTVIRMERLIAALTDD